MIALTELAAKKLLAYLSTKQLSSAVRVFSMQGCGGPVLGIALDERKAGDDVHESYALTLLIDLELSRLCGKVTIDYIEKMPSCGGPGGSFVVTSTNPLPRVGADGCGGSFSSGSCG